MSANIKLIVANVPGVGECIGLVTGAPELFLTSDNVLNLVDALLALNETLEARKPQKPVRKAPALRVVGGSSVH
jgi:hypothetical protein